jgi:hypothetical protein
MSRPQTWDHLKSRKKPNTQRVLLSLDPDVADRYNDAKSDHNLAKIRVQAQPSEDNFAALDSAFTELEAAEALLRDNCAEFLLRSIGRRRFEELVLEHQPTPEQREKAKRQGGEANWNGDTFPQALVYASLVSPEMTEAEVKEMWNDDDWSAAETTELFMAALNANANRRTVDLPKD